MSSIRGLSYAAPDPWAGAADILTGHRYVSSKQIRFGRAPADVQSAALRMVLTSFWKVDTRLLLPSCRASERSRKTCGPLRCLNGSGALRHLRERRAKLDEVLFALHLHVTD